MSIDALIYCTTMEISIHVAFHTIHAVLPQIPSYLSTDACKASRPRLYRDPSDIVPLDQTNLSWARSIWTESIGDRPRCTPDMSLVPVSPAAEKKGTIFKFWVDLGHLSVHARSCGQYS